MIVFEKIRRAKKEYFEEPDEDELPISALDIFPMKAALGLYTLPSRSPNNSDILRE